MLVALIPRGKSGRGEAVLRPKGRRTWLGLGSVIKCVFLAREELSQIPLAASSGQGSAWHTQSLAAAKNTGKAQTCVGNHSSNTSPAQPGWAQSLPCSTQIFGKHGEQGGAAAPGHCRWESVKALQKVRGDEDYQRPGSP